MDGGPPPSSEGVLLTGVEKDLQAKLPRYGAVHVLSVTSRGNREWTAYAPSHDWMHSWAPAFASRWFADHTCQISADEDAGWTVYQAFSGRR